MQSFTEHPEEGIWFERLVDGELSQEEYQRLVASLDERPAGWKQCALAFLEAQALSRELGGFGQDGGRREASAPPPADDRVELGSAKGGGPSDARLSPWGILGIAASFLFALGIGLWMGNRPEGGGGPATRASLGLGMGLLPQASQAAARPAFELAGAECNRHQMNRVTLVVEGPDEQGESRQQYIDLPLVSAAEDAPPGLDGSAMPDDVRQALERAGHRVERRRQYYPVRLRDGRQIVLPIEEVEIVPVKQTYQ